MIYRCLAKVISLEKTKYLTVGNKESICDRKKVRNDLTLNGKGMPFAVKCLERSEYLCDFFLAEVVL